MFYRTPYLLDRAAAVHQIGSALLNSILPLNIFAYPFPHFCRVKKSEIWPQFSTSLVSKLPSFWNVATYRYRHIRLGATAVFIDWSMLTPMQYGPPLRSRSWKSAAPHWSTSKKNCWIISDSTISHPIALKFGTLMQFASPESTGELLKSTSVQNQNV